ncbi:P-loop containing nucleoside triphosphate hydrolase protein [Microdochium trichocladiopsis]|uniref:P-loop containing nucleoside triphosphate hydrolase protein n=1 Tax=Microdochium trichocladiopsis TaxID=1682393 RepID=A0A9P8YAL0_9PEZI|nr:P-loop containing nucleoside triphosphate hydrolase protein [Microdochium trichocladiopsis]KAH7032677.1 P-loop containing nucleoside triphosphate hydrolase protein [Microdochium trichocladiopsis]
MQEALRSIIGKHSQIGTSADPIIFEKPYYALFHCRKELREMATRASNVPEQTQHLGWLNDFISNNLKALGKVQTGLVDKGLIDFKHLPLIFEAGSVVVGQLLVHGEHIKTPAKAHKTKQPECFLFHRLSEPVKDENTGMKYIDIEVLRWGYNGSMFGLTKEKTRIKEFAGSKKITDLDCFPLQYLGEEEKNSLIPRLVQRGKMWCQNVDASNFQYQGIAMVPEESKRGWETNLVPKALSGRIILDHHAFMRAFPALGNPLYSSGSSEGAEDDQDAALSNNAPSPADLWTLSSKITIYRLGLWSFFDRQDFKPTDAQALLCPGTSLGYSLQGKEWGYFDVDLLNNVEWAKDPLGKLEVPQIQKDMLLDLITDHNTKSVGMDVAAGKGEGLIFLLCGPPGCGKTLTAEMMAEQQKRALIRVTSGDLGDHPGEVDQRLTALLELALRASAVVLIDEADTFLAKRTRGGSIGDYFHNAIVAIFLKQLEYFPGIIFLTTNQDDDIDPAVISRVIRLRYGRLNPSGRAKIWRHHLSRAEKVPSENELDQLCARLGEAFELDGREIKTLSNLSLTICRSRKREISEEVVRQLFDLTHGTSVIGSRA